jgi:hypothetical protein
VDLGKQRQDVQPLPLYGPPSSSLRSCAVIACCAVWSNFEIADLDFFRSQVYTEFFEHLDSTGGFYYEVRPPPAPSPAAR